MASPFASVTSARGVAAAEGKLGQISRDLATDATFRSSAVPIPKIPPLSRELRLETADFIAFWATLTANSHGKAGPQAVGAAVQKVIRDIRAIRATCARQ
jgi:hypothetical protein